MGCVNVLEDAKNLDCSNIVKQESLFRQMSEVETNKVDKQMFKEWLSTSI